MSTEQANEVIINFGALTNIELNAHRIRTRTVRTQTYQHEHKLRPICRPSAIALKFILETMQNGPHSICRKSSQLFSAVRNSPLPSHVPPFSSILYDLVNSCFRCWLWTTVSKPLAARSIIDSICFWFNDDLAPVRRTMAGRARPMCACARANTMGVLCYMRRSANYYILRCSALAGQGQEEECKMFLFLLLLFLRSYALYAA